MTAGANTRAVTAQRPERSAIEVVALTKAFGPNQVLRDASFTLERGEIGVLQGENGQGKTTLVRILATVVRADSGAATVAGHDVVRAAHQVRGSIGVAFVNDRSLYWRLGVRDNLEVFGVMAGLTKREARARASSSLSDVGLVDRDKQRVGSLSTGQRQRLMLARALLCQPAVLLLDEPLRGLDDDGCDVVLRTVTREAARGATVLMAAPAIADLASVATTVLRLRDGTIDVIDGEVPERWLVNG